MSAVDKVTPPPGGLRVPAELLQRQMLAILTAWGMPPARARTAADVLLYADLHGIDSHGLSMLPVYDGYRRRGEIRLDAPEPTIQDCGPAAVLLDAHHALGHAPGVMAMECAMARAGSVGVGLALVRASAHFGAAGFYTRLAAEHGMLGFACTTSPSPRTAPTLGAAAVLGTNPLAFAAPGRAGTGFALDMATTTVAFGKIRNAASEGRTLPPGWGTDRHGRPSLDPREVMEHGFLTPLGGTAEGSSHKGYGLAVMVDILAGALSGAMPRAGQGPERNSGHFFLAIDPGIFGPREAFGEAVEGLCARLRATTPADPGTPVLVAGDPERAEAERRRAGGIPVGAGLMRQVRALADEAGAGWHLG